MISAKLVKPEPVEDNVQLTMSIDVAKSLYVLTGLVAGDPGGYRKDTEGIYRALQGLSINFATIDHDRFSGSMIGLPR